MTSDDPSIRPYTVAVADDALSDLHRRLDERRPPAPLPVDDWSTGVPSGELDDVLGAWRAFDWRAYESGLNELPHFMTDVDGQTIHFVHVESAVEGALPVLLLHGWPGSFLEFRDLIGRLTDPEAHGGDRADAVSVVVPSLPGFGFSTPLVGSDWTTTRVAAVLLTVMDRLGYEQFAVQGGDLGAAIAPVVARTAPDRVVGVHVNGAIAFALGLDAEAASALTELEQDRVRRIGEFMRNEAGYMAIQSTRPGLIGAALTDSPAGLAAWMIDKMQAWSMPADSSAFEALGRDFVLGDLSLYWFTASAGSAAYVGYAQQDWWGGPPTNSGVPTASIQFAHDIGIRSVDEGANTIVRWTDVPDRGGHFAAIEQPETLVDDLRAFLRGLRQAR